MGKTQTVPDYPRGITFEQVWAALMENRERYKELDLILKDVVERQKEDHERQRKEAAERQKEDRERQRKETTEWYKEIKQILKDVTEQQKETALQMQETDRKMQETDRQMKETGRRIDEYNKRFGDFTNRFGEIVEYMIAPNLLEKFKDAGLCFTQAGPDRVFSAGDISFEVDVLLENGDKAMLVEIKTKLTTEDVREHIKRLEKMRIYADLHNDKRTFLGAAAGVVMTPQSKKFALGQGFYVVEPSGETFNITPPAGKPKEW